MCQPSNRDISSLDGIVRDLVVMYLYSCLEIKERREGREFCRHSGGNSSSLLAVFSICSSSLWWTAFLFRFQDLQTQGFFNTTVGTNFLSLRFTCLFVRKQQIWPFTKSDRNLFLTPSILQTEVQWSPSDVSCFDVNTSSVYLNKELGLEGLNILCQIKTLYWLDKYQVHLLKSFWGGSTHVYRK